MAVRSSTESFENQDFPNYNGNTQKALIKTAAKMNKETDSAHIKMTVTNQYKKSVSFGAVQTYIHSQSMTKLYLVLRILLSIFKFVTCVVTSQVTPN